MASAADELTAGNVCMGDDDLDGARRHWESAFRAFRDAGEWGPAIRMAADLASLHASGLGNRAVARGWLERGRRLLPRAGHCVDEGYLSLAILACDVPDVTETERNAALALELAIEFGDADLEARALAEGGFALVARGRASEGFARLEEAMAAITAGEVRDPSVVGKSFCAMLSACDRAGEVERAQEWTSIVARVVEANAGRPRILHMHCRVAYGSVLSSVGRWSEAEVAILDALGPSASQALVHRVEATARLAELRLLQGRVEEAAALLAPYEDCLACYGPLARLHLATGEPDLAAAAIERARRELVGDRLREGPLLALLVQVEVARDALDAADRAADALALVAAEVEGPVLAAEASLAAGRVAAARADHERASAHLRDAVHRLGGDERPLLAGQIRLELAAVLTDAGDGPGAIGEARAALALFSRLGAQPFVDQATALLRSLGDSQRPPRAPAAAVGALTAREREVLELIRQGLTNAEIGDRLYISAKTAEHHVSRVLTKLGVRSRAEAAAVATTAMARN